jgi:hypothetical protein
VLDITARVFGTDTDPPAIEFATRVLAPNLPITNPFPDVRSPAVLDETVTTSVLTRFII